LAPLERHRELTAIDRAIAAATAGDGSVVVLEAGPGLGKTALIDEARRQAAGAGLRILDAVGSTLEATFAFGLVLQMLTPVVRDENDDASLFEGGAALAEPLLRGDAPPELSGFALLNALYWLTVNLAERAPLALLVDDLHWGDARSVRFLAYLANRLGGVPIALIVATRPPQALAPAEELAQLVRAPDATQLRPGPLSPEAVTQLVRGWRPDAADEFCAACHQATAGNPLFLRELLIALESEGVDPTTAATERVTQVGPAPVSRAVFVTLRRLESEATAVARALAILGDGASIAEVAALASVDEDAAVRAAAALAGASLLRGRERLEFAHPIVRQALYEELQPVERGQGHAKAARLLLALEAEPARVAAQLLEAPPSGSQPAVEALRTAAAEASGRGDPATAALLLRRAIGEPPDEAAHAQVLLELGRAEFFAGHPNATEPLVQAYEAAVDPQLRAAAALSLGRAYYAAGRFADAAAIFAEARDHAREGDEHLALELNAAWAAAFLFSGDQAPGLLVEAYALVDPDREPRVLGERLLMANVAGFEMLRAGDREIAIRQATTAWGDGVLLEEAGVDEPALWAITGALIHGGDWDAGLELCETVMARSRREGSFPAYATACYIRGHVRMFSGDLARAYADIEVALNARAQGWETYAAAAYWCKSEILREFDRVDEALAAVTFDGARLEEWSTNPVFLPALIARAHALVGLGRAKDGLAAAEQAGRLGEAAFGATNPALVPWGSAAGTAAAHLGDMDAARNYCEQEVATARRWGAPYPLAAALRYRGLIEKAADGIPYFEEALDLAEATDGRLEQARTLVALGTALRVAGRRGDSRDVLRRGFELSSQIGAVALARRAQAELAAAGARPRRVETSGLGVLTPSELRVADLAAGGLSNREIAEALFVTKKAVEYHLSNVYRKLDLRGRDELSAVVSASGSGSAAPS
jgi:DNA-binding CsgD family transcriptional regulator